MSGTASDGRGRLEGRVAFVTGAARGQGRAHAQRLAREGARIVAVDLCRAVGWVNYPAATPADLEETAASVRALGGEILTRAVDVRDKAALDAAVAEALETFGPLGIVVANAGIASVPHRFWEIPDHEWQDMLDINLTGVWRTVSAAVPSMIDAGRGGSIILTSSGAAIKGAGNIAAYTAAKSGLIGLMRTMARELAPYRIRVNTIAPANVRTPMLDNPAMFQLFRPDLENPTIDDVRRPMRAMHLFDEPWADAADIAAAAAFLASDDARWLTGHLVPVDLGGTWK